MKKYTEIFNKTFNKKVFLTKDYRIFTNNLINHHVDDMFDKVVNDPKTDKFRKTLKVLMTELEKGSKKLIDVESCVYEYLFNEHDTLSATERYKTALFYMLIWLEDEFPTLLKDLSITLYSTDLKVGEYSQTVEVVEFKYKEEFLCIIDLDMIDTVEFIVKKTMSKDPYKNHTTFNQAFEDLFLAEGLD